MLSTYTVSVLRIVRTDAAWLGVTEYDELVAAKSPPARVSPPTYRLKEPAAPTAALKKAPNVCVVGGSTAVDGSGIVSAGVSRLVLRPTAEPADRRLVPLNKNMSGPLRISMETKALEEKVAEEVLVTDGAALLELVGSELEVSDDSGPEE